MKDSDVLIFVLDDNRAMLDLISELLEMEGLTNYKVFTDPNELLQNISLDVRVCIVDYLLQSKMNGIDVIKQIQQYNPACYFIMITGYRNFEVVEAFCNTVIRGRFVLKAEVNMNEKMIKFIREFIEDIKLMEVYYLRKEELVQSIEDLRTLIKRRSDVA